MTETSINADVTMVDAPRSGAAGRLRPRAVIDKSINVDVTMVDPQPSGGAGRFRPGDEILGRYVVESELGQGGMGVVYLCLDKTGGVKVAVKGLPPEVSHNSDEMEAVRDNYQLVSGLQHQNIATVRHLEKDVATGDYFLVMTYARGISLKHWLRDHGGREHRAAQLKILRQIAAALDYAHNAEPQHIIHRDIKPGNVMVDEHGNAMVLDFGLAAQVRSSMSRVSQVVTSRSGTPAYKSPEQWLAQPQHAASDQYSLGVIAYQMFAGELPFDSDDVEILKHAVAFDRAPKIRGEGKSVNAVFAKVLAKKPQDRFASCSAFVDALEGKNGEAGSSSGGVMAVVVGALLVFLGFCGWWVWEDRQNAEEERQAELVQSQERSQRLAAAELQAAEAKRKTAAPAEPEKTEAKRVAEEPRKAAGVQKAAPAKAEPEHKAKAEAQPVAEEPRKAEDARGSVTARRTASPLRRSSSAKAEEKPKQEETQKRDPQQQLKEETQKAIGFFKRGDWQSGLEQAEKADQENAELQFWLGTCYDIGLGAKRDAQKATACFKRAAEKGQVDAQCELARRYESGLGVNKDLGQAKRWYQTAASQGSKTAKQNLSRLRDQENAAASQTLLTQSRKAQEAAESENLKAEMLRAIEKEDIRQKALEAASRAAVASTSEERVVSFANRSCVKFQDSETLSQLKFSSSRAKSHYETACSLAEKGASNRGKVKSEYDQGRGWGGPEWPELEAWLEWWK